MKYLKLYLLAAVYAALLYSCTATGPENKPIPDMVTVKSVASKEIWLKIPKVEGEPGMEMIITRQNREIFRRQFPLADTVICDDSLLPDNTYIYEINILKEGKSIGKAAQLNQRTLPFSNHDFTWQNWVFGTDYSSTFHSISIVSENNIWAVGEIYMRNSNDELVEYAALHWDGIKWEPVQIKAPCSWTVYNIMPYDMIYFSENDICFLYGGIQFYDGNKVRKSAWLGIAGDSEHPEWNEPIYSIFGFSSNELYIGGRNGELVKYKNSKWTKLESGTTSYILDLYGVTDPITSEKTIYCASSNIWEVGEFKLLTIDKNDKIDSIHWDTGRRIKSVWTENGLPIYTCGGGIFENKKEVWNEITSIPLYFTNKIRGSKLNDIVVGGDFGLLAHYNGNNWKVYRELINNNVSYLSVGIKGDIIVAVGALNNNALITMGKR